MSDEVMMGVRLPRELKNLVDADSRTNQEVVRAALWREFGGRKKSALEAKKEHKLQQLEAIKAEIESERDDLERVRQEVEAIDSQIEKVEANAVAYEDFLGDVLDDLEHGGLKHLTAEVLQNRDGYEQLDTPPAEMLTDARELAIEQERDLLNTAFMSYQDAQNLSRGDVHKLGEGENE